MKQNQKIIIAIDGYSSCGKSTIARQLARKLGYKYIDTGAMYRAVTLWFIENKIDLNDQGAVEKALGELTIDFVIDPGTFHQNTYINGVNVEEKIRGWDVSGKVSTISILPAVRKKLVGLQQKLGKGKEIVMDGRDIGTQVFPDAELKIFLTADPNVRAERRYKEIQEKGNHISYEEVLENLKMRDHQDTTRKESPLQKAADAKVLDNTHLTPVEQLEIVYGWSLEAKNVNSDST